MNKNVILVTNLFYCTIVLLFINKPTFFDRYDQTKDITYSKYKNTGIGWSRRDVKQRV